MVKINRNFSLAQVKIISPECHFDLKHYTVQKIQTLVESTFFNYVLKPISAVDSKIFCLALDL